MSAPGFICKRCGSAAPVGVGYADHTPGARQRSERVTRCACGWSVDPRYDDDAPRCQGCGSTNVYTLSAGGACHGCYSDAMLGQLL